MAVGTDRHLAVVAARGEAVVAQGASARDRGPVPTKRIAPQPARVGCAVTGRP